MGSFFEYELSKNEDKRAGINNKPSPLSDFSELMITDDDPGIIPGSEIDSDLAAERRQEYEVSLEFDEHPEYLEEELEEMSDEHQEEKMLKREIRAKALRRLEDAARTQEDFEYVLSIWNRNDSNRERRERYHEVSRGDVPLDFEAADDPYIFPEYLCNEPQRDLRNGPFITLIYDCPFEIHELVAHKYASKALYALKPEHKEILHFRLVRKYTAKEIAEMRGQTDRNIRKVYHVAINKVRKNMLKLKYDSPRIRGLVNGEIKDEHGF